MTATLLLAVTLLLRSAPALPISRWLARGLVDPPARLFNRSTPRQWAVILGGAALIGLAIWFEVDEIRLLAGVGGSVGEIAMLASTIEWGGVVELAMVGLLSRTMVARFRVLRHYLRRRAGRTTIRARRPGSPANDDGEGEPGRLAA